MGPQLDVLQSVLEQCESERAARFRRVEDAQRFIARRGALRIILGGLAGEDPATLRYCYGQHGKPAPLFSSGLRLFFSAAASDEVVLLAVSPDFEIGVDVERLRPNADLGRIARDHFSPREQASLETLPPSLSQAAFYRVWTAKEAMLKALGVGLSAGLAGIEVDADPRRPLRLLDGGGPDEWGLHSLETGPGYAAALAAPARPFALVRHGSSLPAFV